MDFYRPSGAVSASGLLLGLAAGAITACVLGVVYSYLIVYVSFIYLNPAIPFGYAAGMGWMVAWGAKTGKMRNRIVVGIQGGLVGLLGLYVAWGVDLLARFKTEVGLAAFHPAVLSDYVEFFYQQGFWSLFGDGALKGAALGAVWGIEAGILVGGAAAASVVFFGRTPFCEACKRWCTVVEGVAKLQVRPGQEPILERLLAGDLDGLDQLFRASRKAESYLRLDVARCDTCSTSNYLNVRNVVHGVDKDGNARASEETLLRNLVLREPDMSAVRHAGRDPAETPARPAPPPLVPSRSSHDPP